MFKFKYTIKRGRIKIRLSGIFEQNDGHASKNLYFIFVYYRHSHMQQN
jgi:hypothetical protein